MSKSMTTAVGADMSDRANNALLSIGVEPREIMADVSMIDKEFRKLIPSFAAELLTGTVPKNGFGITGKTGVGKTLAMVCLMRENFAKRIEIASSSETKESQRNDGIPRAPSQIYQWIDWPATAHNFRTNAVSDSDRIGKKVSELCKVEALILDDLGSERRKAGGYQEDYSCGELDFIISARYRKCLPTWYTTNLDQKALVEFYGSRMVSRLCGPNPLVEIMGKDRRIQ